MQDRDIVEEGSLREACRAAGLEQEVTDHLIGRIGEPAVKDELKRSTQEALDLGVCETTPSGCGLLVMSVSSAGIWGSVHCGSCGWRERDLLWQ